jgi:hypothetical protein
MTSKKKKTEKTEQGSHLGHKNTKPIVEMKKEEKEEEINEEAKKEGTNDKIVAAGAKKEENKKEVIVSKKKQNIQFIIFAAVLILILLAIVFVPRYIHKINLEKNKYNNFEFAKGEDGFWYTVVQKGDQPYQIPFYYHPSELEDIPVEAYLRAKFFDMRDNNGSIYITMDPDSANNTIVIAGVEIARITGNRYGLLNVPTHSAFIKQPKNATADTGTPIVTCNNANNKTMVIWLTLSNKNIVYSYDYCVVLEAKNYRDMIRVADRLMYHLLGIMLN